MEQRNRQADTIHADPSPLAGQTVRIREGVTDPTQGLVVGGAEYRLGVGSWMTAQGNPAALHYALRTGLNGSDVPTDDEVLYGKIGTLGHLVHVSEVDAKS